MDDVFFLVTCHGEADCDALGALAVLGRAVGAGARSGRVALLWPGSARRALCEAAAAAGAEEALALARRGWPDAAAETTALVVVVADTGESSRLQHAAPWLARAQRVLVVDHHQKNRGIDLQGKQTLVVEVRMQWGSCTALALALLLAQTDLRALTAAPDEQSLLRALCRHALGEEEAEEGKKKLLSPEIAALALAGVLADTEGLTGPNTRRADVLAVAVLHLCSPRLDVVRRLVGPVLAAGGAVGGGVLSDAQHAALKQLLASMETRRTGEGALIGLAHAVLDEPCPGFSNVVGIALAQASQCSAIFAIGVFERIVVVVGRASGNDPSINCAQVLHPLGGGGHPGAAAATLHQETFASARDKLLSSLVERLGARTGQALTTVEMAMSKQMVVLFAPLSVVDAQRELVRRGVRQAPLLLRTTPDAVVLLGLADRHLLDRAVHLGLAEADTREVMLEAPVCQIDTPLAAAPSLFGRNARLICVMDDSHSRLIGLVHRSAIASAVARAGWLSLASSAGAPKRLQLERHLPHDLVHLLIHAGRLADSMGATLVAAGGVVRDAVMGRPVNDVDLMVSGCDAKTFAGAFHAALGDPAQPVLLHEAFHTAVVTLRNGHKIDIATARSESYPAPAALPVVELASLRTDLGRRDFSINALALHLNPGVAFGQVEDHYNSLNDIEAKRIAVLHPLSFVEDPTRLFRAVRFAVRYDFHLCPMTHRLAVQAVQAKLPHRLSGPRLFHELQKMMQEEGRLPAIGLARCHGLGLLEPLHPALQLAFVARDVEAGCDSVRWTTEAKLWGDGEVHPWKVLMAALVGRLDDRLLGELGNRLLLSPHLIQFCSKVTNAARAARLWDASTAPSMCARVLRSVPGAEGCAAVRALLHRGNEDVNEAAVRAVARFESVSRTLKPLVGGDELVAAGLRPGPVFARVLAALLDAVVDGTVQSTREAQLDLALRLASQIQKN